MTGAVTVEAWSGKDRADENFPVGSALIRRDLRPHVHAFYAFARNADDIADSPALSAEDKLARLDRMEAVLLGRTEAAAPSEAPREVSREVPKEAPRETSGEALGDAPSARRLRASLAATGTTPTHATELLIAFRRDATRHRCADWDELLAYCRYSAMPVGRHVLDLHGEDRATWASSDALCTALQVLNHLQDAAGDLAALDRCYLPQDLLARHGAAVADLRGGAETPGLRAVFDALLDRTEALNTVAARLPGSVRDRRLRLETAVIAGLARRLARRLRREDPLARRVKLRRTDMAGALLGALRFLP